MKLIRIDANTAVNTANVASISRNQLNPKELYYFLNSGVKLKAVFKNDKERDDAFNKLVADYGVEIL